MRTQSERELVKSLRNEKKSFTEIGNIMGLSRHTVRKLYVNKVVVHSKKMGRKCVLQNHHKLQIKRRIHVLKMHCEKVYSSKLKRDCNLNASTRTIRRHLANIGMTYRNVKKKIFLTKTHKEKRVEFAKKMDYRRS